MCNKNEAKDLPYAIFMVSMSCSAVILTILITLGALGVLSV